MSIAPPIIFSTAQTLAGRQAEPDAPHHNKVTKEDATGPSRDSSAVSFSGSRPVAAGEGPQKQDGQELSEGEQQQVDELKQRDAEVRAHEQAHASAGGSFAGSPSYEYTTGPDGKRYATGGEVQIDSSPVRDNPSATIRKMDTVIRAALAPSEPSSQDMQVARAAQEQRSQAQAELAKQRLEENSDDDGDNNDGLATNPASSGSGQADDARNEAIAAYGRAGGLNSGVHKGDALELGSQLSIVA